LVTELFDNIYILSFSNVSVSLFYNCFDAFKIKIERPGLISRVTEG